MLQDSKNIKDLFSVLSELPERCREVFMLCKLDGYSYSETAERLGISVSTVEKHMVKALRLSRAALMPATQNAIQMEEPLAPELNWPRSAQQKS